jgi:pantoate--beta-alanine ligase
MGSRTGFGAHKTLNMILFKKSADLIAYLENSRRKGLKTGFVPTMGALHAGHLRLINASQAETGLTVCSIFVNPYQFNDPVDFEKYPITTEKDIQLLEKAGTDVLFLPSMEEIYPAGKLLEKYELGYLATILEGRYRPGHYQGVSQVMSRLLTLVKPGHLFMGQKDFQQCLVVKQLITILQFPVKFHIVPTLRESDGLALSSRNSRLSPEQRVHASAISEALCYIRDQFRAGDPSPILRIAHQKLETAGFKTDYIAIAKTHDLRPLLSWDGKEKAVALIAASQGEVRLIDNMLLN